MSPYSIQPDIASPTPDQQPLDPIPPTSSQTNLLSSSNSFTHVPTDLTKRSESVTLAFFTTSSNPTVLSFTVLSTLNQHFLNSLSGISEPQNFNQAIMHPGWQKDMEAEFEALGSNHSWDVIELLVDKKALPCK